MKTINVNLRIYGISIIGTLTIDESNGIKLTQDTLPKIFDTMKRYDTGPADGFENTELLNHESRQNIAKGLKERLCKMDLCFKKNYAKGLCSKHYQINWRARR